MDTDSAGVYVDRNFWFHDHVKHIARNCNQRFYLLQQTRKQGLNADCLKILFHLIVGLLSKILYTLSDRAATPVSKMRVD